MDYTEKYELDTKAGNRLGRRLRALGGSIGKGGGKIRNAVEAYDPNAFDGDGDGLIQDGSPWERPVVARSQVLPTAISAEAEIVASDERIPQRDTQYTRQRDNQDVRREALRSSGSDELDLYEDTEKDFVAASATGGSTALRDRAQELRDKDHRLPGSTADMTPEELAELAVPGSFDEMVSHAATQAVGHPSQYASQADYEKALETQKAFLREMFGEQKRFHDAARTAYDAKYGTGAFEEDAHRNKAQFRQRMTELLGDHTVHSSLVGTPILDENDDVTTLPGLEELSQETFLDEIIANPNTPPWKRDIYKAIRDSIDRQPNVYLNAVPNKNLVPGGPDILPIQPMINPLHAFAVYLLAGQSMRKHDLPSSGGDGVLAAVRNEQSELRKIPQDSWNTQSMNGEELLAMVYEDYFAWSSVQQASIDAGVSRGTGIGSFPTNEQIRTRIELASRAKNIHFAMHVLFPGQTELRVSEVDQRTGRHRLVEMRFESRIHSDNPVIMNREQLVRPYSALTHDKDTVEKMRASLARSLRENPIMLELFRTYGVPAFSVLHPLFAGEYQRLPDDAYVSAKDVLDRTPSGRQKLFALLDKIANKQFMIRGQSRNTSEDGRGRSINPFFTKMLRGKPGSGTNLGPNGVVGRVSSETDVGGDTDVLFGVYDMEGIGGFSTAGSGTIALAPQAVDIALMTPIGVSEDIIDTSGISSITTLGPAATPLHEWVHWYHEHAKQDAIRILRARAEKMEQDFIQQGDSPRDARKKARQWMKKTAYEHGIFPDGNPNVSYARATQQGAVIDWPGWWHMVRKSLFGDDLYDKSDPDDPRAAVPMQRPMLNFDNFADYGYASKTEMEDAFLLSLYRLYKEGFQRGGLLSELSDEGIAANPIQNGQDLKLRRQRAARKAVTSTEGYVRTPYGQSQWKERVTEAAVGAFMRIFRDKPFMVNDAMLDILTTFFMRRDKNGELTERHGIVGIRRRKRRGNGTYSRQYEEDLVPSTSTKRAITADERRGPDGHRESLRSAGRVSAVDSRSMRFDPDERSRLRSGASNIGLDTDERLYAFDEPISVSDFRARARTLSIGDHHFYDSGVPYSQSLGSRRRAILGMIAGRAYVNRTRPHEGDMVRAISATQFGMFVDDMPTYDTTTENDRAMLRGLVSGRIVDLPMSSRARIETALKNATHIHSAVQSQTPNKHELYRVVNAEPRSFVEGLVVGERIPMPITAFTRTRPRADAGETVIRIQRGAKAIDVEDGQFLTQGTFEVVALDMVDGQITATLKHVETYDPRHDAMRPVDRFSDKPGAMRKFGSPRPRYTQQEQQRMEVDLARRTDKAEMDERMYGLRSSGASGLGEDIDKELDLLVGVQELREPASQGIIKQLRAKIRGTLQAQVDRRLDKAREVLQELYGGFKPWREDAEIINRYAASDPEYRQEVLSNIFERMKARVIETAETGGNTDAVQWAPNSTVAERKAIAEGFFQTGGDLTLRQLDTLIESGQLEFRMEMRNRRQRIGYMVRGDLAGRVAVTLTNEEREVLSVIRDFLKVGSRAYMIDVDNPREFNSAGRTLTVVADPFKGEPRFKFRLSNPDIYAGAGFGSDTKYQEFWFSGEVRRDDVMAGNFNRIVSVNDGLITVEHSSMNMMGAGGGAATILNQHSWQWWRQLPGTRVVLTAADDGPIVWPRHGFHPNRSRFEYGEETGVDFNKLIRAVSYIIGATSSDQQTRMNAYRNRGDNLEGLVQARVDSDGNRKELSENDKRLRERLGLWLALAIKDRARVSNNEPKQGTLVLLANLLDVGDMDDTQLNAWKYLFADVYYGQYKIELDGFDNDPDFLPSFIVNDEDPTAAIVARRIAIAEERAQNASMDLFTPNPNNENANPETVTAITARVSRVGSLYANSRAANDSDIVGIVNEPSNEAVLAREMAGGEELPRLISKTDAEAALSQAINDSPNVDPIRPWLSARDPERGRTRVVLVGISQDSRRLTDVPSLVEVAGNFLRQNRTRQWDEIDNRFRLDPIFTSTPGEFVERFIDPNDPTVDPADNKVGLLGITDQNARWITRDEIGAVTNTVRGAIQQMYDDSDAQLSPSSRWEKIQLLRDIKVNGKNLYKKERWLSGYVYTLDPQVLDEFVDKYYPDADKLIIRSIFGSFGDHITMHEAATETSRKNKIETQATWLYNLFTRDTSDSNDSRARQTLASILGYDFLDETPDGSTRSTVHVLNRGALTMVDEPVSLSEINGITGITTTPRVSRSLRSSGISTTMMLGEDGAPTLLELNDPLGVTATGMRSLSYSRSLRQDYGINSPRSLRSGGTKAYERMMEREREWSTGRNDRRQEIGDINSSTTPKMYAADINTRMEEYTRITEGIEEIDDELSEIDNRLTELTEAGELTPELEKEIDDKYWSLEAQKTQLEMDKKDIADSIASDINTLNEMMDIHEKREGLAFAIRKFLSEQVSLDIPESYREKLRSVLADLEARAARAPSTKDLKARHKILSDLLDDDSEFDIRWDITRDDDDIEGVDLEDFDDDFEWAGEKWLEWIYRSFFDPSYEEWRDARISRAFEKQTEAFDSLWRIMGMDPPERKQSPRRMLEDMIDNVVKDITRDERSLWSRQHDEMLRNEYNADYEEAIIDATPADSSAVPRNVPERTWKKILASARLARRTPYEGERDAALRTAKRLIEPHRPDLADDDYMMSLRSSGGGAPYPMISGVNFNRMGLRSRGSAPEVVTVPKPDRFHSRLIERLSKYDIKEKDLMVDGKYGKVLALLMSPQDPLSIDQLENIIDNPDDPMEIGFGERMPLNEMLPEPISDQDKEVLKEIIRESAKIAAQSGWGITAIEGHRVKKINGAHHEELTDVLVDEVDLAMIRAMGSPTYERIARIHGVWARTVNRLNKMFGAYESREDDGAVVRVGSDLEGDNGSYRSFLDGGDAKIEGDVVNYYDTRGNLVMSVNRELGAEKSGRITTPKSLVLDLGRNRNPDQRWRFESTTANDAIMEAMFLAAGVNDFSIQRENEFAEEPQFVPTSGRSLTKLRARLARAKEQAQMMSFAPTPAGRHMEDMFLQEVKRLESHIDMYERLGQRFVRLIQESEGISKDEVGERIKKLANTMTRSNEAFSNGTPASELSMLSMYEIALSAFMSMRLGSRNMPRISDEEALLNGTHEIGHFVFGQAFTRHGEFMSNFWPYATMGPEFWTNFVQNQLPQSEIFDRFTLEEGLGLRWTREQRELFDSLSEETKELLIDTGIVDITGNPRSGRAEARRSDVEKFRNDIIRNVEEDPTIDDIEKAEIITGLRQIELSRETSFSSSRREQFKAALDGDLTPEVLRTLRIDPLSEDDPHVARWSTSTPWDQFVRIEPSDIGWQRTSASGSSLRSSGAPSKTANREKNSDDETIIKLAEEGLNITQIARQLGQRPKSVQNKVARLRRQGKIGNVVSGRNQKPDDLTIARNVSMTIRMKAFNNYKNNLANGMSRADAVEAFLEEIAGEDSRLDVERTTKATKDIDKLLALLDILYSGIPKESRSKGVKPLDEDLYIIINELKLFGFSIRETKKILKITSQKRINRYRQIHYRAYLDSMKPQTLRSSGASPDVRARVRDSVQAVAAVDGDVYDPLYELLVNEKKANFSNQQRESVFRRLAEEIEDLDKYDITIPMDDEGLEELAATLFRRALGRRAKEVVLTNNLRQGLAEFIRLRAADERDRRSRREEVTSFPSTGASSLRSSGENISTFGQMLRDQELAEASRLAAAPSRGETPISDEKRRELVSIGRRSRMTEERLDSLVITEKAESEFTVAEYEEVTRLLDDSDTKLDKASEMLEDKRMRLQDEQWNLQNLVDANRATDRQYVRLSEVEELLEELERQEEILNRGYEANRLARLMIRALRANSNNPRRDEYDNKYIIIRNADGTLAGMTMWGFLGVDVTFNTPEVPYAVDATALPAEDRITGRMVFVDYLMSFQNVPGMGSYLFRRVLEDARGRNARKVFLETTDSSRPYWEQVGFAERRIAGSTSQYHEYVARVDEMLEVIESSGSTLRSSGSTLRSSGGNETKKPKREMRSIPGISGLWPHYTHSDVLISPQVRPKLRTARGSRRRHTAGPLQVTGYEVTIEFDDNPKTADSYRTMPFTSAIQAARYIDEHMNAGATVNDGKLVTKREYIGRIGTTA